MSAHIRHNGAHNHRHSGHRGTTEASADRQLIFVRDDARWERDRKRILDKLVRFGFPLRDRICISVALDEAVTCATGDWMQSGSGLTAMVAYSVTPRAFHVHVRLVDSAERTGPYFDPGDADPNRWMLVSTCMTDMRLSDAGAEIDMWKRNSAKVT